MRNIDILWTKNNIDTCIIGIKVGIFLVYFMNAISIEKNTPLG